MLERVECKAKAPRAWLGALFLALAVSVGPAVAQQQVPDNPPRSISGTDISILIRSTIVALHQANITGNYSVLHDLGDARFQAAYGPAELSEMFRAFRERGISLAPAMLHDAQLTNKPVLTEDGLLRVAGTIPTTPEQIIFNMTFFSEGGIWRINAITAGTQPAPVATISNKTFEDLPEDLPEDLLEDLPEDLAVDSPVDLPKEAPLRARPAVTPVVPMPRLVRDPAKLLGTTDADAPQ